MKSKAPLSLMEQMIMILVFSLASALCLKVFVESDRVSRFCETRDRASLAAQSAAEVICSSTDNFEGAFSFAAEKLGGHFTSDLMWIEYDENWQVSPYGKYRLEARNVHSDIPGLQKALILITDSSSSENTTIFELEIAWQEVDSID